MESRRMNEKKRRDTIRASMDKASAGVVAANEIIELLEKDNAMFAKYLEHDREQDKAAAEREAGRESSAGGQAQPKRSPRQSSPRDTFLTSVKQQREEVEEEKEVVEVDEPGDVSATLELSSRLLLSETRRRLSSEEVNIGDSVKEGVRALCLKLSERPEPRYSTKKETTGLLTELGQNTAQRAAEHRRPRQHQPDKQFAALQLPSTYAVVEEETTPFVERSGEWMKRAREKRDAERERRRLASEEEREAGIAKTRELTERSSESWLVAKAASERTAKQLADAELSREAERSRKEAAIAMRQELELKAMEQAHVVRERARRERGVKRRKDAPIDRPTRSSLASQALRQQEEEEAAQQPEEEVDADPYAGLEPFRFDPRVLELIGEKAEVSPRRQRQPSASSEGKDEDDFGYDELHRGEKEPDDDYEEEEQGPSSPSCFFDSLSSAERGRVRLRDAREFSPNSMGRSEVDEGVVFLVGSLVHPPHTEHVICALFDRSIFTQEDAFQWWQMNNRELVY